LLKKRLINKVVKKGYGFVREISISLRHVKASETFYNPETGIMEEPQGEDARFLEGLKKDFDFSVLSKKNIQAGDFIFSYPSYLENGIEVEIGDSLVNDSTGERFGVVRVLSKDSAQTIKSLQLRP
jgi:hypothetical protein